MSAAEESSLHDQVLAKLAELRATAEAASPAPWHLNGERDEVLAVDDVTVAEVFALSGRQQRATAEHIATWNPSFSLGWVAWAEDVAKRHEPTLQFGHPVCRTCSGCGCCGTVAPCADYRGLAHALGIQEGTT